MEGHLRGPALASVAVAGAALAIFLPIGALPLQLSRGVTLAVFMGHLVVQVAAAALAVIGLVQASRPVRGVGLAVSGLLLAMVGIAISLLGLVGWGLSSP